MIFLLMILKYFVHFKDLKYHCCLDNAQVSVSEKLFYGSSFFVAAEKQRIHANICVFIKKAFAHSYIQLKVS